MAKKSERWQGDNAALQNPFAALSGLKKTTSDATENHVPTSLEPPQENKPKTIVLPKVKSSRLERAHRGGKTVTIVAFHGSPDQEAKNAWLKAAKTKLGIGGTLEDGYVVLQGDQRERVMNV